jgi:glycosyltransferase involved in cell wall biosynthesis
MTKRKKKVLYQSDFCLANTGFGRNTKAILEYLHSTGKYDLVNYVVGMNWSNPLLQRTPWKSYGTLPDSKEELNQLNQDPNNARRASYGDYNLNKIVEQEKPDVYIAVQDIWGIDFAVEKPWFDQISSVLWTTLDSLPILPTALQAAKNAKNFWVWSNFAEKAMRKYNFENVKTVHGAIETSKFYRLLKHQRVNLRKQHNIPEEAFIVGFVFRNQLRKSVPNLLEGFSIFQKNNPSLKTKLLLHTHFSEGWQILKLAKEYNVSESDILTSYICKACRKYSVRPFSGEDSECVYCKNKSCITTNVSIGVTEDQLNEIYNLMNVYCHPFTSGGQEVPIQEAKLAELITLVTNYSCGEEMCEDEACSLPLDWSEYREHGTEFIKASTSPISIAKQLQKVLSMDESKKRLMERGAREWALKNFSVEAIGKKLEEFIDNAPFIDGQTFYEKQKNPYAIVENILDDEKWIISLYKQILSRDRIEEEGKNYWLAELKKGQKREVIENYFRQIALQENNKNKKVDFKDLLDPDDEGKRMIVVMPESGGDIFLCSSLFEDLKNLYPNYNLYVATKPEFFDILQGNPYVHKILNYIPQMDQLLWLEGQGSHYGYFEIAFLPHLGTQRLFNYHHNGKDKISFEIKK